MLEFPLYCTGRFNGELRALGCWFAIHARGFMYCFTYAYVCPTAAKVSTHSCIDLLVCGLRSFGQQGRGGHDLSGLTVTALGNVYILPGSL